MGILVQMCSSVCCNCGRKLKHPVLGDFSYGSFILSRKDGLAFRYMDALENHAWDFVKTRLKASDNEPVKTHATLLQEIVARIADSSEGQAFTMSVVCPSCKSQHTRDEISMPITTEEIPYATFDTFMAMDEDGKIQLLEKVEERVRKNFFA